MSTAGDWGIPTPSQGMPITPFATPFQLQGDALATALDLLKTMAFPRFATRASLPTTGNLARQHATVFADPTPANNGDYYWSGSAWIQAPLISNGKTDIGSNGSGNQDITHGLARTPQRIFLQPYGPRTAADSVARVTDISATTFSITWYYNSGSWTNQSGTGHGVYWKAEA